MNIDQWKGRLDALNKPNKSKTSSRCGKGQHWVKDKRSQKGGYCRKNQKINKLAMGGGLAAVAGSIAGGAYLLNTKNKSDEPVARISGKEPEPIKMSGITEEDRVRSQLSELLMTPEDRVRNALDEVLLNDKYKNIGKKLDEIKYVQDMIEKGEKAKQMKARLSEFGDNPTFADILSVANKDTLDYINNYIRTKENLNNIIRQNELEKATQELEFDLKNETYQKKHERLMQDNEEYRKEYEEQERLLNEINKRLSEKQNNNDDTLKGL